MTDPVQPVSGPLRVHTAIQSAARATGVDFGLLVETARRESALNPHARAATSSATGLFQFIESTWLDMVKKHGADHGLGAYAQQIGMREGRAFVSDPDARAQILALRNNPEVAARMAAELTQENAAALQARLGRAPRAGELYAAHVMGPAGAARLIEAAQSRVADASALFPREAAANRGLFFAGSEPLSAEGVLQRLSLDADATISTPTNLDSAPMSPALAHALFTMALMPLLRGGREDEASPDPLAALRAYAMRSRASAE